MTTTGPNFPSSVSVDSSAGDWDWVSTANITAKDATYTETEEADQDEESYYLVVTNFGFAIASPSDVVGVTVELGGLWGVDSSDPDTYVAEVRLVVGGVITGDDKGDDYQLPASPADRNYGGASDDWGLSLDDSDVNSTAFGVAIRLGINRLERAAIDSISVTLETAAAAIDIDQLATRSRARAITNAITVGNEIAQPVLRSRVRTISIEAPIGINNHNAGGSRSRIISPEFTAGRENNQAACKSRARVISPAIVSNIRFFVPTKSSRARVITPNLSFGKSIDLGAVQSRARVITPLVTTPVANTVETETLAGRARVVTPTINAAIRLELKPLRVVARAVTTSHEAAFEVAMPTLTLRRKTIVLSVKSPTVADPVAGPLLGGFRIVSVEWATSNAIRVRFTTSYGSTYLYQLYAGRCLIGVTQSPLNRAIVGQLLPSDYPVPLQLVAVDRANILVDYGARLPPRPYNRVMISFDASGFPADSKWVDVTSSTAPGGAVDDDNLIAREEYDGDRSYTVLSEPLGGSGLWSFEAFGRDNKLTGGNKGAVLELSQTILAHPPDVVADANGKRLTGTVAAGALSVDFTYPTL